MENEKVEINKFDLEALHDEIAQRDEWLSSNHSQIFELERELSTYKFKFDVTVFLIFALLVLVVVLIVFILGMQSSLYVYGLR